MRICCDLEANGLENPTHIWVICCQDLDTDDLYVFRKVTHDEEERRRFLDFTRLVNLWVGHNFLEYDLPVLNRLLGGSILSYEQVVDTLIVSKLVNFSREGGHSIEQYGEELGIPKLKDVSFSEYSPELELRCVNDTRTGALVFKKYEHIIVDPAWSKSLRCEHEFQFLHVNGLRTHGFGFNLPKCESLLKHVEEDLSTLDREILAAFPPRLKCIKEITPKVTKHGTLNKQDFKWVVDGDLSVFNGGPFCRCGWVEFNPDSAKQRIEVLAQAGWKPVEKTKTHIETERDLNRLKYQKNRSKEVDLEIERLYTKLQSLQKYGYKTSETNLLTLPDDAPPSARLLAKRIMLESRRRTLTEWKTLCRDTGRIHGKFYGIGCWTHRMAHQNPNTANIPTGNKLYAKEMRALWCAPKGRLLVGVDADSIQFRIAAHYINDPELISKIVNGKKSDGTDPHSYNKRVIGDFCKSRDASKRTLFSLILGGGIPKLAEILGCSHALAEQGRDNLYAEYPGLVRLKQEIVVDDAKQGFFLGLDGRRVHIPGDTFSQRKHLCSSGYLQNGEAVVMKHAAIRWYKKLREDKELLDIAWFLVNLVHDEYITEGPNDVRLMHRIGVTQAQAIAEAGEELGCRCPLAGSYARDNGEFTIGTTWYETH